MEALVSSVIGSHANLAECDSRIVERSGGNPFFAEEIVHSLIESQAS